MNRDERAGILVGLTLLAANLPEHEPAIYELAEALQRKWNFGSFEYARHKTLCSELKREIPVRRRM
jgi:hypothetical protein